MSLPGQPPFFSWGFSVVTHLTCDGLYVSPLVVIEETRSPECHLTYLIRETGQKRE